MIPTIPSWDTLSQIMPEIWLAIGMCAVILVPFIKRGNTTLPFITAIIALFLAGGSSALSLVPAGSPHSVGAFTDQLGGMLTIDPFSQFFKILLATFTILVILQWYVTSRRETAGGDAPDLLCLLLGATLGMSLMASASNLLMIFVATEAASFPSYALAGFRKRHRTGSEGSLKYVVFGAASSAIMVYGMSLLYGITGTLGLAGIAAHAAHAGISPLFAIGMVALFAGFAFKLSAVPMHFWCPDVFEGAPTEVTTFLSVASKGAAICLVLRTLLFFASATRIGHEFTGLATGVAILGAITATWGNLVAMHQTKIKRLLAYSSIAHAGYMIMAASMIVFQGHSGFPNPAASAILFYLLVYMFMNLGAFTVAAIVAGKAGTEDIRDYAQLSRRSPVLAILLSVFLLSLFGMPGLGGFMGKIYLATSMTKAGAAGFALIAVLFINTLLSLYYYVRPVYYMYFVQDTENRPTFSPQPAGLAVLVVCAAALFWTGCLPSYADNLVRSYATLQPAETPIPVPAIAAVGTVRTPAMAARVVTVAAP